MSDRVSEFLRELAPMREARFWHNFISRLLSPGDSGGFLFSHPPPPLDSSSLVSSSSSSSTITNKASFDNNNRYRYCHNNNNKCVSGLEIGPVTRVSTPPLILQPPLPPPKPKFAIGRLLLPKIFRSTVTPGKSLVPPPPRLMSPIPAEDPAEDAPSASPPTMNGATVPPPFQSKSISPEKTQNGQSTLPSSAQFQRSLSLPIGTRDELKDSAVPLQKSASTAKKAIFASSSFYDPDKHPTIEEQVTLCREIAKQLVSDRTNAKSKGREMFERRVQKSARWVTENEDSFQNFSSTSEDYHERTISEGPPNLKLLLDPRHVEDINTVQGVNEQIIATQEAQTRDTCRHIVADLTSPQVNPNRGNTLFARRVQQSDQWIIDEVADTVIDSARDKLFRKVKYGSSADSSWSPRTLSPAPSTPATVTGIPGPIFSPLAMSPMPSRPSSSMSMLSQFRDFNPRPKPFCRAY